MSIFCFLSPICNNFKYFQLPLSVTSLPILFFLSCHISTTHSFTPLQNFANSKKYTLKQLIHTAPHFDVTAIFHLTCLFIFSLAGILNFSTRHIGTIIFTLFYAPCWVCLQAHSQASASSAADNLLSSVGLVYYSVPKGHSVLWVALIESCWIFYQEENQQWAETRINFLSLN